MDPFEIYRKTSFSHIDRALAKLVGDLTPERDPWIMLAAAMVSKVASMGHACLDLKLLAELGIPVNDQPDQLPIPIPLDMLLHHLKNSPAVGAPEEFTPLILHGNHLYLHRFWKNEAAVAHDLLTRCKDYAVPTRLNLDTEKLRQWFPMANSEQILAMQTALTKSLTIISGGPGCGKTFTIAMLIVLMSRLAPENGFSIRLAAPTGKAAFRLQAAVQEGMQGLANQTDNLAVNLEPAQTLHRLLGARPGKAIFRFNAKRKLTANMVIVDEASMIDLRMMASLLAAIESHTQLVLLGDKDQLASVAPGAVLGDICSGINDNPDSVGTATMPGKKRSPCADHIIVLQNRYRYSSGGGIDLLADSIKRGQAQAALELLNDPDLPEIRIKTFGDSKSMAEAIQDLTWQDIAADLMCDDPTEALARLQRMAILSPIRNGPYGAKTLNYVVEQALRAKNLIGGNRQSPGGAWYNGKPIMITRNDYSHGLFNGDVGVTMTERNTQGIQYSVCFADGEKGFKQFSVEHLAAYETAYALTVHKSQGSEYNRVILVLPRQENALLSRELIYTAISRARHTVEVWGDAKVFGIAVNTTNERMSGLADVLWRSDM